MIQTNWHTHTARCGHAIGTDEEYVQAAIQAGFKTLGFSDHAPYLTPYTPERMNYDQLEDYKSSILSLKEKYKGSIDIYLGMEVEYYPSEWEQLSEYRRTLDYCILGQHNLEIDHRSSYGIRSRDELKEYTDRLAGACEHALCDYIAHPDVALWSYPYMDGSVTEAAERIADLSLHYNMPLEINCGSGVSNGKKRYSDGERYAYPTRAFFEVFAKRGCPLIIGLDVHNPRVFLTDVYLERALSVLDGLDCNILYDFDLVKAAEKRKKEFF